MPADFSDLSASVQEWVNEAAADAIDALGEELRELAPVGEGDHDGPRLNETLEVTVLTIGGGEFHGQIAFTAEHASYTDEGTDPHIIEGNPLLAFEWEGRLVIVRSVNHPGYAGTGWFTENCTDERWAYHVGEALGLLA